MINGSATAEYSRPSSSAAVGLRRVERQFPKAAACWIGGDKDQACLRSCSRSSERRILPLIVLGSSITK
jgi:hypothetical protein